MRGLHGCKKVDIVKVDKGFSRRLARIFAAVLIGVVQAVSKPIDIRRWRHPALAKLRACEFEIPGNPDVAGLGDTTATDVVHLREMALPQMQIALNPTPIHSRCSPAAGMSRKQAAT